MEATFFIIGFEKLTGLAYSKFLAQLNFWIFFVDVNLTFFSMHYLEVTDMFVGVRRLDI